MVKKQTAGPFGCRSRSSGRTAAVVVEFAMALIPLSILIVGMLELGRGIMVKETISNAAMKGARVAILPNGTSSQVTQEVNTVLQDNGIDPAKATTTIKVEDAEANASTAKAGDRVSVQVSVPFSEVSWTASLFLKGYDVVSEPIVMMKQ